MPGRSGIPFLAAAEKQLGARVLADGTGLVAQPPVLPGRAATPRRTREIVRIVLEELAKVDEWGARTSDGGGGHPVAAQTGLEPAWSKLAARRYQYGVKPVTPDVLAEQQKIADVVHELKLIPKPIVVDDAQLAVALNRAARHDT